MNNCQGTRAAESRGQKLGHVAKMPQIRAPFQNAEGTSVVLSVSGIPHQKT